jgi:UDP-N-acetylglucosamine--N-acetylmuramyl-(pentapeptide) pyrophosphoryl-undecaprenol N-acetylglucosamine transferase
VRKRILIMAGGTGGHIFPALAVAKRFKELDFEVYWLGSQGGLEQQLVSPHYPIFYLSIKGMRGKGLLSKFKTLFKTATSIWQASRIIANLQPCIVLGMGGFASGPGGLAAWLMRKPLIVHEQNAIAGMTNRWLAKFAKKTLAAFPHAFPQTVKPQVVGNPVREAIFAITPPEHRLSISTDPLKILVLGGSQGALAINQTIVQTLQIFPEQHKLLLWHQTGKNDYESIKNQYREFSSSHKITPFIDDMASAYAWADLVIARSGALTVAEIAAAGAASLLIPFPHAVDDHQFHNAQFLEKTGAAFIVRQPEFTPAWLCEKLTLFLKDRQRLLEMAIRAKNVAKPHAVNDVITACLTASTMRINHENTQ